MLDFSFVNSLLVERGVVEDLFTIQYGDEPAITLRLHAV